jgi:hypothetical protein
MPVPTSVIFAILSLIFGTLALRDYLKHGRSLSPAGRTWLRVAVIFGVVALWLVF